jgi:hypothetical protein
MEFGFSEFLFHWYGPSRIQSSTFSVRPTNGAVFGKEQIEINLRAVSIFLIFNIIIIC